MKLKTKDMPVTQPFQVLQTPNERAGISPVTVRRLMADLEYNYHQGRKVRMGNLPERGPVR